jgi:hypothetical protein
MSGAERGNEVNQTQVTDETQVVTDGTIGGATDAKAVWFFSGDLLFASRIQSAAQRHGVAFSLMGKWPETWTTPPGWVIVDLATRSGGSTDIRQRTAEAFPGAVTIAYGPHVQPARLSKARQDGFAAVMTRGQFDAALPDLFQ